MATYTRTSFRHKQYTRCLEEKSISDFHPDPGCADGHRNICKPCRRAQLRAWKLKTERVNAENIRGAYDVDRTGNGAGS